LMCSIHSIAFRINVLLLFALRSRRSALTTCSIKHQARGATENAVYAVKPFDRASEAEPLLGGLNT